MQPQFFQDFLFEGIPVNSFDVPKIDLKYAHIHDSSLPLKGLSYDGCEKTVFLTDLLQMKSEDEWEEFLPGISVCSSVSIVDDLPLRNSEIAEYKLFYLKAYCSIIQRHCPACYIVDATQSELYAFQNRFVC